MLILRQDPTVSGWCFSAISAETSFDLTPNASMKGDASLSWAVIVNDPHHGIKSTKSMMLLEKSFGCLKMIWFYVATHTIYWP